MSLSNFISSHHQGLRSAAKFPLISVNGLLFVFKFNGPLLKMERNFDAVGNIFAIAAPAIFHPTDFMKSFFFFLTYVLETFKI